jgi:hypothetical protein
VKNTFLNGELREDVYMRPPFRYSVPECMVCHIRRSLYGLKQAPQACIQHFASVVTAAGFSAGAHDPALFVHVSPCGRTLVLYVDDMIITSDDPEYIAFVKTRLSDQFLMSDLDPLRYLSLGLRSSPHMRSSFCLKRSIFRIFLIMLLLLITVLLRLPWSSMFT